MATSPQTSIEPALSTIASASACLLSCLRAYFADDVVTSDQNLRVADVIGEDVNWQAVVELANRYSVMPLLYQSLKRSASWSEMIPATVLTDLGDRVRRNGLENFARAKTLLMVVNHLKQQGIAAIPFKGATLAMLAYSNLALRQFSDLDILVPRQQFWQAKEHLVDVGYQVVLEGLLSEMGLYECCLQIPLKHLEQGMSIDLHWGVPPQRSRQVDRFDCLWQHVAPVTILGQTLDTFSPEATLVIQCMNVAKEPWAQPLKQLCDVAQMMRIWPNLNWQMVWDLAAALHSQRLLLIGLAQAHRLFDLPLPDLILQKLHSTPIAMRMAQTIEQRMFCPDNRITLASPREHLQYFFLDWLHQIRTMETLQDLPFVCAHFIKQASLARR